MGESKFINIPENLHTEIQNLFVLLSKAINDNSTQREGGNITMDNFILELNKILTKLNMPLVIVNKNYLSNINTCIILFLNTFNI